MKLIMPQFPNWEEIKDELEYEMATQQCYGIRSDKNFHYFAEIVFDSDTHSVRGSISLGLKDFIDVFIYGKNAIPSKVSYDSIIRKLNKAYRQWIKENLYEVG